MPIRTLQPPIWSRHERLQTRETGVGGREVLERITEILELYMAAMMDAFLEGTLRPITAREGQDLDGGGARK